MSGAKEALSQLIRRNGSNVESTCLHNEGPRPRARGCAKERTAECPLQHLLGSWSHPSMIVDAAAGLREPASWAFESAK